VRGEEQKNVGILNNPIPAHPQKKETLFWHRRHSEKKEQIEIKKKETIKNKEEICRSRGMCGWGGEGAGKSLAVIS